MLELMTRVRVLINTANYGLVKNGFGQKAAAVQQVEHNPWGELQMPFSRQEQTYRLTQASYSLSLACDPGSHRKGLELSRYFRGGLSQGDSQRMHPIKGNVFRRPGYANGGHCFVLAIEDG
jgi:hypothetical protein